jgi:hypothetical protein
MEKQIKEEEMSQFDEAELHRREEEEQAVAEHDREKSQHLKRLSTAFKAGGSNLLAARRGSMQVRKSGTNTIQQ